jgi:hypothetical protein
MGSTDRWLRTRQATSGALFYSILGPQHSRGGDQTIYSTDGYLAVHNLNKGPDYRVYRVTDGLFLGTLLVTIDSNGLVQFAPDAQLQGSIPKAGEMSRWPLEQFTVVSSTGSGYHVITTTNNLSRDGFYQSVATQGNIKILYRKNGSLVSTFPGGAGRGFTPASFTPDGNGFAAWDSDSNRTTLWRVSDGAVLRQFRTPCRKRGSLAFASVLTEHAWSPAGILLSRPAVFGNNLATSASGASPTARYAASSINTPASG